MSTISSQSKFYQTNKDKVLAYKKQYYQEKNKSVIALKQFQIIGLLRSNSNKILKKAYENGNFYITATNQFGQTETIPYCSYLCSYYKSNGILDVEAYIKNPITETITNILDINDYDNLFDGYNTLYLTIKYPIIKKE